MKKKNRKKKYSVFSKSNKKYIIINIMLNIDRIILISLLGRINEAMKKAIKIKYSQKKIPM